MRLDVVLPAHNEEARIDRTLDTYRSALPSPDVRFWVALDGCVDRTAEVVRAHAADDDRIGILELPKLGKGGALTEAFRRCAEDTTDAIGFVDADCATPPAEFVRLVEALHRGADAAIASRRHPSSCNPGARPFARRMTSAGFAVWVHRLFDLPYLDTQCGAKVLRADVVRRITPLLSARDFLFDVDLLVTANRLGYHVAEVPTVWIDRAGSRLDAVRDAKRMLWSSLQLWMHHRVLPVEGDPTDEVIVEAPAPRSPLSPLAFDLTDRIDLTYDHELFEHAPALEVVTDAAS